MESPQFRLVFGVSRIEYDPNKEERNRKEKKYSLESAVHFLQRRMLPVPQPPLVWKGPFEEKGECRYNLMSLDDDGTVVFFVITMRANDVIRVISFRAAHEDERAVYWEQAKAVGFSYAQQ